MTTAHDLAAFAATCDDSLAALQSVADHRRVELLANQINATLQHETNADALLAIIDNLAHWLHSQPPDRKATGSAVVLSLICREILDLDA
jgi:hypothetical protein